MIIFLLNNLIVPYSFLVREIFNALLQHQTSNAFILDFLTFGIVHVSAPYRATLHAKMFIGAFFSIRTYCVCCKKVPFFYQKARFISHYPAYYWCIAIFVSLVISIPRVNNTIRTVPYIIPSENMFAYICRLPHIRFLTWLFRVVMIESRQKCLNAYWEPIIGLDNTSSLTGSVRIYRNFFVGFEYYSVATSFWYFQQRNMLLFFTFNVYFQRLPI